MISDACFVFQIGLVTQYWTKYNVVFVILSVVLFFLINRITQSPLLFQKSPIDYAFVGKILLKWFIVSYFQPSPLMQLLYLSKL